MWSYIIIVLLIAWVIRLHYLLAMYEKGSEDFIHELAEQEEEIEELNDHIRELLHPDMERDDMIDWWNYDKEKTNEN